MDARMGAKKLDVKWTLKTPNKQKTRISTRLEAGCCTLLDFLKRVLGGDRWT